MACPEAVYLSYLLLIFELVQWRSHGLYDSTEDDVLLFQQKFQRIYIIFLAISLMATGLHRYNMLPSFLGNTLVIALVPYFYLTDSIAAVALANTFLQVDFAGAIIFLELLSNFFLLHVISKTFSPAKTTTSLVSDLIGTSKQFLHHSANYIFLCPSDREVVMITAAWRAISMSGHAAQLLHFKKIIDAKALYRYNWMLSHIRNIAVIMIFAACLIYPSIAFGFGKSAIGHVIYMLLRGGPVFRLGSVYVGDRLAWQGRSDSGRLAELIGGKHRFLSIEIAILIVLALYFLYLRFTIDIGSKID